MSQAPGHRRNVPTAYGIIQKALTNVLKHAGTGARASVTVAADEHQVAISVVDTEREGRRNGGCPPPGVVYVSCDASARAARWARASIVIMGLTPLVAGNAEASIT